MDGVTYNEKNNCSLNRRFHMPIPGNLLTTAMAVMPHKDVGRAIEMALFMDVPFWPQLPLYSYYEDMYVQASEHFLGILRPMPSGPGSSSD